MPARLAVDDYNPERGPEPGLAPLLLLGALGSQRSLWEPQGGVLAARRRVLALDLRGHGDSEVKSGTCTMSELAGDVVAAADATGVESFHVAGISLGGAVALCLALEHPGRVRSVAVLCSAAKLGDPAAWAERAETALDSGTAALADTVAGRWVTDEFDAEHPGTRERFRGMIAATSNVGYAAACLALAGWDARAELGQIATPTLVVAADHDSSVPAAVVRDTADRIPGARFELLGPSAHLVNVACAKQVTALLAEHAAAADKRLLS